MTQADMIAEAEKRYPIGTKFIPAHIKNDPCIYTVKGNWKGNGSHNVSVGTEERQVWTPLLYYDSLKKWAEIVSEEVIPTINNHYSII